MLEEESEIIERQATINIGTIGHVAHGKTTVVQCISGVSTIRHKLELERNITIKLGYANAKIYECKCERPEKYSTTPGICSNCNSPKRLVRHVSFVDCPGHDVLMTTMLTGTAIMDAALLLVASNEPCPQPQTTEHLFALEVMNLKRVIVVQNKIDLVKKEQAIEQYDQIREFMRTSQVEGPVIPVSGQLQINIEAIMDFIVNYIDLPKRDRETAARMIIIRSFDVNKPGTPVSQIKGGVVGGSLVAGTIAVGEEIEIRPGQCLRVDGEFVCTPYRTRVTSLKAERTTLTRAYPGGLIGVGTDLDPSLCKSDRMVGMVMGPKGKLPPIYSRVTLRCKLFQKTLQGAKQDLRMDESILLNIGSLTTGCKIIEIQDDGITTFELVNPCCCEKGEKIAISRKVRNNWRLIGYGTICDGKEVKVC